MHVLYGIFRFLSSRGCELFAIKCFHASQNVRRMSELGVEWGISSGKLNLLEGTKRYPYMQKSDLETASLSLINSEHTNKYIHAYKVYI